MAATIPKQQNRRRAGVPWGLGLLALLFVFWRSVGGPGGWLPGSGAGSDRNDFASSRPLGSEAASRETTVRREVTKQLRQTAPASRPDESRAPFQARVKVAPSPVAAGEVAITLELTRNGANFPAVGEVAVLPEPATSSRAAPVARRYPIAGGRATIAGARRGERFRVKISPEGEPAMVGDLAVDGGDRALELTDRATITGRAVFSGGMPAGDQDMVAKVFRAAQPAEVFGFKTMPDGAIEISAPPGHDVLLELRPKGVIAGTDIAPLVFHRDALEPASIWDLGSVTFEREIALAEGTVEDAQGKAVPNATVLVLPLNLPHRALAARSDEAGRFVVKGPPAVDSFEIFASTENEAARLPALVDKGATGLRLVLAPAGRIRGTVVSPGQSLNQFLRIELETDRKNVFTSTGVGADGTFEFPHVPAGRWSLGIAALDHAEHLTAIEVPAGATSADPRLSAVPIKTDLVVKQIRVIDPGGAPIAGARIKAVLSAEATVHAKTDDAGRAEIVVPEARQLQLLVEAPGFAPDRELWDWKRPITLFPAHVESAESR